MTRSSIRLGFAVAVLGLPSVLLETQARPFQPAAVIVEPAELVKRDDLVGREVIVDDRLRFFQFHPGQGYDEILLKRTPVIFQLPRPLRPKSPPGDPAIQVRGVLKRDGAGMACEVKSFQLFPSDAVRLDRAVAGLPANDFPSRKAWSTWGLQRAQAFDDRPLREKALQVEGDAFRLEAESLHGADAPRGWMQLAEQARSRQIPEPEPSALAHKAFRANLGTAASSEDLAELVKSIERFFPKAKLGGSRAPAQDETSRAEYSKDPGHAYRTAPADVRSYLDRRLWVDAMEKRMRVMAQNDPRAAIDLASRSETELPEQKELAADLINIGIESALRNVAGFRLAEAKAISQTIRDRFHKPESAETFLVEWLKAQRGKLSQTDADGRLSLATRYEELTNDRRTAMDLIRQAWKIDPNSKDVIQAFRRRGYHKIGGEWVEDGSQARTLATSPDNPSSPLSGAKSSQTGMRGLGPEEVRQKLGSRPARVVYSASKGKLIEQWIYFEPTRTRYVNFIHTPNQLKSKVISDYSLQRTLREGQPALPR